MTFKQELAPSDNESQIRIAELELLLHSMVSAIDTIWSEQAFPRSQSSQIHNYDRAKKVLAESGKQS